MRIAIIGAGAMGCLYGAKLSASQENEVFLLDVWKDHVDQINANGLRMEVEGKLIPYKNLKAFSDATKVGPVDLAIVFVKSTLTKTAIESNKAVFGESFIFTEGTVALTLQNGLGNIDQISQVINETNVIAGTTAHGATMLGPGKMRHAGVGKTIIGEISGKTTDRITKIAEVFKNADIDTDLSDNVLGLVWDKLMVNVGINAIVGITNITNGEILDHPELTELLELAVTESKTVAEAKGIKLNYVDPVSHTKDVCKATSKNKASMLQDILNGKKTEIDMINGAIVREAKPLGIATPVNQTLTNLIKFLEKR